MLDEGDPVDVYEEKGKKNVSQYDQGMEALSNMNRIQQVEVIHGKTDIILSSALVGREGSMFLLKYLILKRLCRVVRIFTRVLVFRLTSGLN